MSSFEQLKQTFFDECGDLLQQIETSLTEIREGSSTDDTINAVFRAVHSIKGGAGIFGFETLVKFAHVFETVMDAIRSGRLAITPDNIDTLLAAGDVLADLVNMSRSDEGPAADYGSECRAALEDIMRQNGDGDEVGGSDVAADFDDIDFTPVMAGDDEAPADAGLSQGFSIVFRPRSDLLKKGNEPLHILRELRQLGELELAAETDRLPSLAEMEFDQPYIGWTGTLRTSAARADVEAIFDFVSGDCDLEINDLTSLPPNELVVGGQRRRAADGGKPDRCASVRPRRQQSRRRPRPQAKSRRCRPATRGRRRPRLRSPQHASSSKRSTASSTWSANW